MDNVVIGLIRLYQKTLSPDHGIFKGYFPFGVCRHGITCSEYCLREIKAKGLLRAFPLCLRRILSCRS